MARREGLFVIKHDETIKRGKQISRNTLKTATSSHTCTNHGDKTKTRCARIQSVGVSVMHSQLNDPLSIPAKERQRLPVLF